MVQEFESDGSEGVEAILRTCKIEQQEAIEHRLLAEKERDEAVEEVARARALMAQDVVELEKEVRMI